MSDGLNYAMMDDCMRVGLNGGCGPDCHVLQRGDCECEDEMIEVVEVPVSTTFDDYDRAMKGIL